MGTFYNTKIVTDGLVLGVDPANTKSYNPNGTNYTWYDADTTRVSTNTLQVSNNTSSNRFGFGPSGRSEWDPANDDQINIGQEKDTTSVVVGDHIFCDLSASSNGTLLAKVTSLEGTVGNQLSYGIEVVESTGNMTSAVSLSGEDCSFTIYPGKIGPSNLVGNNNGALLGSSEHLLSPPRFKTNATARTNRNFLLLNSVINFSDASEYSFDFWVKLDSLTESTFQSLSGPDNSISPWLTIYTSDTNGTTWTVRFREDVTNNYFTTSNINYDIKNNWGNIAVSSDSSRNFKVYLNGKFLQTLSPANTVFEFKAIGGGYNSGGNYYPVQGSIGGCKVYNRVLTDSEIAQNFEAMRGRFGL
jgi:hypothetical protein